MSEAAHLQPVPVPDEQNSGLIPPTRRGGGARFISDVIAELGFVPAERVHQAVEQAKSAGETPEEILVGAGDLTSEQLARAIAERFGLDFVDLLFCHRPDPHTPIEETVFAMSDIVSSGKALYWGTSEWGPDEIRAAWDIADRHHLHKPAMEQPQYHLTHRRRVEQEYARLYDDIGLGLTTWSPLASGLWSGKYVDGIPEGSRGALEGYEWLQHTVRDERTNNSVRALKTLADDLGCSLAQLAIAWCAHNPHVSTVITGASRVEQVKDNLGALDVLEKLDADVLYKIDEILMTNRARFS